MTQRLTLALSFVTTAVCVAALVMLWSAVGQNREINAAILEKLESLSAQPAPQAAPNLDWRHLKIRLVKGDKEGAPAEGFSANLSGELLQTGKSVQIEKQSGADGIVDFGHVRTGEHWLMITAPWGSRRNSRIVITPGDTNVVEFICPEGPPDAAPISFAIDLPDELQPGKYWYVCDIWPQAWEWDFPSSTWHLKSAYWTVVLDETGRQIAWCLNDGPGFADSGKREAKTPLYNSSGQLNEQRVPDLSFEPARFPSGYELCLGSVTVVPASEEGKEFPMNLPREARTFSVPSQYPNRCFTPTPGQENQWKIVLTDVLLRSESTEF